MASYRSAIRPRLARRREEVGIHDAETRGRLEAHCRAGQTAITRYSRAPPDPLSLPFRLCSLGAPAVILPALRREGDHLCGCHQPALHEADERDSG